MFDVLAFAPKGTFLDLFAGSGALGLEAASRGWDVICVDLAREATEVIRRNARGLGLQVDVRRADALAVARTLEGRVSVCSAAPPYPADLPAIFQALLDSECVAPGGRYVFQHPSSLPLDLTFRGATLPDDRRTYGSNALTWVRVPDAGGPDAGASADGAQVGGPAAGDVEPEVPTGPDADPTEAP